MPERWGTSRPQHAHRFLVLFRCVPEPLFGLVWPLDPRLGPCLHELVLPCGAADVHGCARSAQAGCCTACKRICFYPVERALFQPRGSYSHGPTTHSTGPYLWPITKMTLRDSNCKCKDRGRRTVTKRNTSGNRQSLELGPRACP